MSSGSAPADVRGSIVTPDQEGFDLARQAFNLAEDQQPAAVAMPVDAEDVAATVRYARGQGLRVAPQTTGHNPRPLGDLGDFLLLKTGALKDVEIDAGSRTARVGSGVQWTDIVPQASDWAWPRCTAPPRAWALPATPSAVGSAGTGASSAWPPTG